MPWLPSSLRNWHRKSAGPSPWRNLRTYSLSSLKKRWLITPLVEPSHFNSSAVPNDRRVPCTPRRGVHRNSIEGSQRLPSLVRKPGSSVITIQESSRYPGHLSSAQGTGPALHEGVVRGVRQAERGSGAGVNALDGEVRRS